MKWNGSEKPIMLFKFIEVAHTRAVVSCKSHLTTIDVHYPKALKKFGVKKIFLFAESCSITSFDTLRKRAKAAGYADLCCLYFTGPRGTLEEVNEKLWMDFGEAVIQAVKEFGDLVICRECLMLGVRFNETTNIVSVHTCIEQGQ